MNGRIYDPQLGRFLQPDPVIQEPTNAQSWNAYTYVFNNPLAYTDPSGMMSERAWNNVWRGLGLVISIISMGATSWHMGISTQAGITAAAAGGFFAGYAATGTLKSAVIGASSAAITAMAGDGGFYRPSTRISASPTRTIWPARIFAVLRSSTAPSTVTSPLATMALPWPPLSARPTSFSSWLSSTWSRSRSKSRVCMRAV